MNSRIGAVSSKADPQPARHVLELGVSLLDRHDLRLERHPALRAGARRVAHDLRVHRAGPGRRRGGPGRRRRLQRHAALRTGPRMVLPDLGIHRADVFRAFHHRRHRPRRGPDERVRRGLEPLQARLRAEVVGGAAMVVAPGGRGGIHPHPADRIDLGSPRRRTVPAAGGAMAGLGLYDDEALPFHGLHRSLISHRCPPGRRESDTPAADRRGSGAPGARACAGGPAFPRSGDRDR